MTPSDCDRLDDYLLGALPPAEAARFAAHLDECPACREQTRRQRCLDSLLAKAADRTRPIPKTLERRIAAQCRRSRRLRTLRWVSSLTAAGLVAAVLGWWAMETPRNEPVARPLGEKPVQRPAETLVPLPEETSQESIGAIAARPGPRTTVTFDDTSPAIAVPVSTTSPNVTIYWVYPTVSSAREPSEPDAQWLPLGSTGRYLADL